jgi:hypothetical protein
MSAFLAAAPLTASAHVDVDIQIAPPAPRVIAVPPPRRGYVWAPGYWRWEGRRHVWVEGRWMRARPHQHWVPEHWDQRGDRWHFERGHWDRD